MTATIITTPVELVEQIFVDMGIGPNEARSMAGEFTGRAATARLSLGNNAAIPPSGWIEIGGQRFPQWHRSTAAGEEVPPVLAADGLVITGLDDEDNSGMSPDGAQLFARHLSAAAQEARTWSVLRPVPDTLDAEESQR